MNYWRCKILILLLATASVNPDRVAVVRATIQVASVSQLARVFRRIEQLRDVLSVTRDVA